jgi:predicted transcriptional regulator YdeE
LAFINFYQKSSGDFTSSHLEGKKMKLIKLLLFQPLLKLMTRKNIVTWPKVIELDEKKCIGYKISTSFAGNQKKKDIPPFWHDVYENDKLSVLRQDNDPYMYCIFDVHDNEKEFDYYTAVENKSGISTDNYSEITLPKGRYVQVEFMKRSHRAASFVAVYVRKIWIELNGYQSRNSPVFIIYDERFHRNYQKYGFKDGHYLGDPFATLHVPVK